MVDPPEGWRYGFPKECPRITPEELRDWFIANDYPAKDVDFAMNYLRFWEVEDES